MRDTHTRKLCSLGYPTRSFFARFPGKSGGQMHVSEEAILSQPIAIARDLWPLVRPIDAFKEWPGNPRQGDIGKLCVSLQKFGQTKNAVVQESSQQICAGNHTQRAMRMLGNTLMAFSVMPLPDDEAEAYLLMDNAAADAGYYDDQLLAERLQHTVETGMLEFTGYDGDDLDDILLRLEPPDPSVTERENRSGDETDFYPVIRVAVPPDVYERWNAVLKEYEGDNDADRIASLLDELDGVNQDEDQGPGFATSFGVEDGRIVADLVPSEIVEEE